MATNETTREYAELRLPIGLGANGKPTHVVIGKLLVTDWGKGMPQSWDVDLNITHLNPVLYQAALKAAGGQMSVVCDKADFSKRYKVAVKVQPPTVPGEAMDTERPPEQPPVNDPDDGHTEG